MTAYWLTLPTSRCLRSTRRRRPASWNIAKRRQLVDNVKRTRHQDPYFYIYTTCAALEHFSESSGSSTHDKWRAARSQMVLGAFNRLRPALTFSSVPMYRPSNSRVTFVDRGCLIGEEFTAHRLRNCLIFDRNVASHGTFPDSPCDN